MSDLGAYRRQLDSARARLKTLMTNGVATAGELAVARGGIDLMQRDLAMTPPTVLRYESLSEKGLRGADLWRVTCERQAAAPLLARQEVRPEWKAKLLEYESLAKLIKAPVYRMQAFTDPKYGVAYVTEENPRVDALTHMVIFALYDWVIAHCAEPDFYKYSATVGFWKMMEERKDLLVLLRLSQNLPRDIHWLKVPVERPVIMDVVEVVVSVIPYVGNAVAIFEATTGRDLFGYPLDPVDRAILASCVLLPVAGRFTKYGRALYTATRLEAMYGRDALHWSMALSCGERLAGDARALRTLEQADAVLKGGGKIEAKLAAEVVEALGRLDLKKAAGTRPASALPNYVADALKKLIGSRSFLAELDELALQRVIDKGPNINLMKGQLLEELLESRISRWLRDPAGMLALGVERAPEGLEFIPGHMIRDAAGRQITDGVLARRTRVLGPDGKLLHEVLDIQAIFEAKAGKSAARELSVTKGGVSAMTEAERAELRAVARDELRARNARRRRLGKDVPVMQSEIDCELDEIEREIVKREEGGQVRRDIERLHANEDGTLAMLNVGGEEIRVRASPGRTKFFGVLPRNVPTDIMERTLGDLGYQFEVLGMNVTDKELVELSKTLAITFP